MKIILKKDVENLGLEFDTVDVKPGYARNFLLPQGYALLATPKNQADVEAILEARKEEEAQLIAEAKAVVEALKKVSLSIPAKVGTGDKLYGSINNSNLVEALAEKGVEIERKYIQIPGKTIKRVGAYTAKVRLHREVEYDYEFEVVSDGTTEAAQRKEKEAMKKEEEKRAARAKAEAEAAAAESGIADAPAPESAPEA